MTSTEVSHAMPNSQNSGKQSYVQQADEEILKIRIQLKDEMLTKLDKKYKEVYYDREQLKKKNEILEREKEDALSRLSKLAGKQLTEGNPNITDLSNPNRPAKLGERWSSLYTDEWTDAFEELSKKSEDDSCDVTTEQRLLQIVDWCYKKCCVLAESQVKHVRSLLEDVVLHLNFKDVHSKNTDNMFENGSLRQQMDFFFENFTRQRQNNHVTENVVKKCVEDYNDVHPTATEPEVKFVEKCSELCWYMTISDPPTIIEYENLKGQTMDPKMFNNYSQSGRIVEFVVWPVLLLHNDGPVLAKGTVQTNKY